MRCAWSAYINLLPHRMRNEVDRLGKDTLLELRMRVGYQPMLITKNKHITTEGILTKADIDFVINAASEYSPWSASTISNGFLTAQGGHRVGICGIATVQKGETTGIQRATSLCIRVARDFYGIAKECVGLSESILILGPPGSGKTTLLRDLIRQKSSNQRGSIAVIDEREEIFPYCGGQACFECGPNTDVLSRSSKMSGIHAVLRCMNPVWIAVDEITTTEDCNAIVHAGWCGVKLIATAHAGSLSDFQSRPIYKPLALTNLFPNILVLNRDMSWKLERITI